jgi:hypothetical protein
LYLYYFAGGDTWCLVSRATTIETDQDGADALAGRRFCEPGIKEPDQNNPSLYFWHYPYAQAAVADNLSDPVISLLANAYTSIAGNMSAADLNKQWPSESDLTNAVISAIDLNKAQAINTTDSDLESLWPSIGYRARVFHPQVVYHTFIRDTILARYQADTQSQNSTGPDNVQCHGVSGQVWVNNSDVAVQDAQQFCGQTKMSLE